MCSKHAGVCTYQLGHFQEYQEPIIIVLLFIVDLIRNNLSCSVREHCYSIGCIYPLPGGRVGPVGGIEGLKGLDGTGGGVMGGMEGIDTGGADGRAGSRMLTSTHSQSKTIPLWLAFLHYFNKGFSNFVFSVAILQFNLESNF